MCTYVVDGFVYQFSLLLFGATCVNTYGPLDRCSLGIISWLAFRTEPCLRVKDLNGLLWGEVVLNEVYMNDNIDQ